MDFVSGKIDTSRNPGDKPIQPQKGSREIAKDSSEFHILTETIVHTARWQEKFTAFLQQLSVVAYIQGGVEIIMPNPTFWHAVFPPKDWTRHHPDAKSEANGPE